MITFPDAPLLLPVLTPDNPALKMAYELSREDFLVDFEGHKILVPWLLQSDGASIPQAFWSEIGSPYLPIYIFGALPHDKVYLSHEIPRADADRMLWYILRQCGVPKIKANIIYDAVHEFGASHWDNDENDLGYIKVLTDKIKTSGRNPADYGFKC